MREPDERDLVEAAQRGDATARERLFQRALPGLARFVRRHSGPALRRGVGEEDLVQTICREAVRDLEGFEYRGPRSFRNWLLARAHHKLGEKHRALRAKKRDPARVEAATLSGLGTTRTPSRDAAQRESVARLHGALGQLPDDYRRIIELVRFQGLSYAEAAVRMGRSEGALRVLLSRALVRLGQLLREAPAPDGDEKSSRQV